MLDQLEKAVSRTGSYAELRHHRNIWSKLSLRKSSVIENSSEVAAGVSARCYRAGGFGFASVPAENEAAIGEALGAAADNAALLAERAPRGNEPLPETAPGKGVYDYRTQRPKLGPEARMDLARRLDDYLTAKYPNLLNVDVMLNSFAIEKALATSAGAKTYCYSPRTVLWVGLSAKGPDGPVRLHEAFGGFGDFEDQQAVLADLAPRLDALHEDLQRKVEGVFPEAGIHDVVLDSDVAGILAHEAIGHTCEADIVLGGSVAGDRLGELVASEKITLVDQAGRGFDGAAPLAIHVDDEGTPCRDVAIIERGVLKEFLQGKETAREMAMAPTGNARAYLFSDEPLVRMRNTAILPGTDKLADMIAAVDRGYYLKRSSNGQADATSEFMFGIVCGYEIRNGKLGRAICDTTISGVAFDMLKAVTHVGDRFTWAVGGWCGKKQIIPVGMGGPAIKSRLNIGGR